MNLCSPPRLFTLLELHILLNASIARKTLREFWANYSDSEEALKAWFSEVEHSSWEYPHASILPDNRVVFNLKGNNYRLVAKINYDYLQVFIRFVGTHSEYDKIDTTTI